MPSLPNDVLVELVDDCLVDPTDAAVLRSVSKSPEDAHEERVPYLAQDPLLLWDIL